MPGTSHIVHIVWRFAVSTSLVRTQALLSQLPGLLVADYLLQAFLGEMSSIERDHFAQVYDSSPRIDHSLCLANAEAQ